MYNTTAAIKNAATGAMDINIDQTNAADAKYIKRLGSGIASHILLNLIQSSVILLILYSIRKFQTLRVFLLI